MKLVWELSCLALNRSTTRDTYDRSTTKQILGGKYKATVEKQSVLEVAYQGPLQHGLEERRILAKRYRSFGTTMEAEKEKLRERSKAIDSKAKVWGQKLLSDDLLSRLETHLKAE